MQSRESNSLRTFSICFDQDRSADIIMPNNFSVCETRIKSFPIHTLSVPVPPTIIVLVLLGLATSMFEFMKRKTPLASSSCLDKTSEIVEAAELLVESSAYPWIEPFTHNSTSAIWMMYRIGDKQLPCGDPDGTSFVSEITAPIWTACFRSDKNDRIQFLPFSSMP